MQKVGKVWLPSVQKNSELHQILCISFFHVSNTHVDPLHAPYMLQSNIVTIFHVYRGPYVPFGHDTQ
jgi:hypothetical protein